VISILTRTEAVRGGVTALVAACALAWPSAGLAADPPIVTRAPDIDGQLVVGATLHAVHGAWSGSSDAASGYTWLRCPDEDFEDCSTIPGATTSTYQLVDADAGNKMRVTLWATLGDDTSYKASDPTGVVTAGGSGTTTTPPSFTVTAPVNTAPAGPFPAGAKFLKPKPVVSITGRYTSTGARITRFTVKAPKGATISVTCSKGTCPVRRVTLKGGHTLHVKKFERTLKAGTRLTVTVSRKGYVSQITALRIRTRQKPVRSDSCLAPGKTKTQKCPAA
jgi:hypothetical protein